LSESATPRRRPAREAATLARLDARAWPRTTPVFRALGLTFDARLMGDDLADYLELILAPLRAPAGTTAAHRFSVVDDGERYQRRYAVYFDGLPIVRTPSEPLALVYLLWHLNRAVVEASNAWLLLHAAAAERDGAAVLLPAPMDAGKSTLVAGLTLHGFRYLTDETVALDPHTARVDPYPKPLSIEMGSWDALAPLRPQLDARFARFSDEIWHVVPDAIRPGAIAPACTARAVVSPRFDPGATTALEPISRAEAVMLLAENAFNFSAHGAAGLDTLATVVRSCECYRLTVGTLDDACDRIVDVMSRLEARV
jgi:HprK-related kinase A